jgi:hypothetical protein
VSEKFVHFFQKFAPDCPPGIQLIEFNKKQKDLLVFEHNKARSEVAMGGAVNVSEKDKI